MQGLEYFDEESILCPGCHTPVVATVLTRCERCQFDFRTGMGGHTEWLQPDAATLPPRPLAQIARRECDAVVTSIACVGGRVAIGCADGVARVYELNHGTLEPVATVDHGVAGRRAITHVARMRGLTKWLAVALSDDGSVLATGGPDGWARLWNVGGESQVAVLDHKAGDRFSNPARVVTDVAFMPGAGTLVTSSLDGIIRLWDVATGSVRQEFGRVGPAYTVAASDDGRLVAAGCGVVDHAAHVWDTATGQAVAGLQHGADVLGVSPAAAGLSPRARTAARWSGTSRPGCSASWSRISGACTPSTTALVTW